MVTGGRAAAGELVHGVIGICAATLLVALFLTTPGAGVEDTAEARSQPSDPTATGLLSIEIFAGGSGVRLVSKSSQTLAAHMVDVIGDPY